MADEFGIGEEMTAYMESCERLGYSMADYLAECPGICGRIARAIDESLQYPNPGISLSAALSFMSTIWSGGIVSEEGIEAPLYCAVIAETGSGKTQAQKAIKKILEAAALSAFAMEDVASEAGLRTALATQPTLLFLWDEFGIAIDALQKNNSSPKALLLSTIMRLYSNAGGTLGGTWYSQRDKVDLVAPYLSIFGASTPDRFYSSMDDNFVLDGNLPRWITFFGETNIKFRAPKVFEVRPSWVQAVRKIALGTPKDGQLGFLKKEKQYPVWGCELERFKKIFRERIERGDKFDRAFWCRGYENFVKVSFAISDSVEQKSAEFAFDLTMYLIQEEIKNFRRDLGGSRMGIAKKRFFDLAGTDWLAHSQLIRRAQRIEVPIHVKKEWIAEAVDDLGIWERKLEHLEGSQKKSYLYRLSDNPLAQLKTSVQKILHYTSTSNVER